MAQADWHRWHRRYDEPGSEMAQRLDVVRQRIGIALDAAPPGPLTAMSMVASEGRDLLPVLATHPRRSDVVGRLVELDPDLAATARETASSAGLGGIDVRNGDAAKLDCYRPFPMVAAWFSDAGFDEVFTSDASHRYGVGVHRSRVYPLPLPPGVSAFTFVGY